MNFRKLKAAWQLTLLEPSFKARLPHLVAIRQADIKELIRLFKEGRTQISTDEYVEGQTTSGLSMMFAERWQRGKLFNVVELLGGSTRKRFEVVVLSLYESCHVGRIPEGYYAEVQALAEIGTGASRGGKWCLNWACDRGESRFIPAVEAEIPRLKEYFPPGRHIQCVWSMRDKRLTAELARLRSRSKSIRIAAIQQIEEMRWHVEDLPKLPTYLATEGCKALLEALSGERPKDMMPILQATHLLARIEFHAPQLVPIFVERPSHRDQRQQVGGVRGLLAIARSDRAIIPILIEQMTHGCEPVQLEILQKLGSLFHHGPTRWFEHSVGEDLREKQQPIVIEFGKHLIEMTKAEEAFSYESIVRAKMSLIALQSWSPKLKTTIRRECGDLLKQLWPES